MFMQYWCPTEQDIVAGDANGVWWQFHEDICNRRYEHPVIDREHTMTMDVMPFEDEEQLFFVATCSCSYRSAKQAVEKTAMQLWWDHYQRAKAQVSKGVDTSED